MTEANSRGSQCEIENELRWVEEQSRQRQLIKKLILDLGLVAAWATAKSRRLETFLKTETTMGRAALAIAELESENAGLKQQLAAAQANQLDPDDVSAIDSIIGPPAPANLIVTAVAAGVALNWTATPDAASFNVYRGITAGGEGGTPLATGVTTPSFSDTTAVAGTTYFYVVSAVSAPIAPATAGVEGSQSIEVSVAVAPAAA